MIVFEGTVICARIFKRRKGQTRAETQSIYETFCSWSTSKSALFFAQFLCVSFISPVGEVHGGANPYFLVLNLLILFLEGMGQSAPFMSATKRSCPLSSLKTYYPSPLKCVVIKMLLLRDGRAWQKHVILDQSYKRYGLRLCHLFFQKLMKTKRRKHLCPNYILLSSDVCENMIKIAPFIGQ